jgi:hypothetical protein
MGYHEISKIKRLQKDYEVISSSLLINNPNNFDNSYHSLADALQFHLTEDEETELNTILRRLQELSEQSIVKIQKDSKNLLKQIK